MNQNHSKKKILIIEPLAGGHHSVYLDWIIKGFIDNGLTVQVACLKNTLTHSSFKKLQTKYPFITISLLDREKDTWKASTSIFSLFFREYYYYKLYYNYYSNLSKIKRPDMIFMPYIDLCLYTFSLFGSPFGRTPWSAIAMRPYFHYPAMNVKAPKSYFNFIKKILFIKLLKTDQALSCLFTIDESLYEYVKKYYSPVSKKIAYLPDPSEPAAKIEKFKAIKHLGLPENVKLILVYGAITIRKGIVELFDALQRNLVDDNVHVVLAGQQDKDVQSFLTKPACQSLIKKGRVHQFNYFLTDEEEAIIFSAVDIVWLGYHEHLTMSGVLVKAGQYRLPIVSCNYGLIGWYTDKYKIGLSININAPDKVVTAIQSLTQHTTKNKAYGKNSYALFKNNLPIKSINIIIARLNLSKSA